ncbi:hypothetical protein FNV43_RR12249 [Rhamnella rubrinervis]|uniref:Uncharacterized protein n=1 Tax=Rhamnella rubrinervis TaxID=2594499 RepID=A0A8K0H7I8_9ROSA|nr:hypothetical protein FNV43_RR12249 [Rhamnella rubrinervis]
MALINVFGSPITKAASTLNLNTPAENKARAERAMGTRFADGKYEEAREAVEQLKQKYGDGSCTLGLIYNATGNTITHVGGHNWEGNIYEQTSYPAQLENGQWGVFLHVRSSSRSGSVGAVVYRGKDKTGTDYDRMLAWYNPLSQTPNAVYTEIREPRHYERNYWSYIGGELKDSAWNNSETGNGCHTIVKIDRDGEAAFFEGILTLDRVV